MDTTSILVSLTYRVPVSAKEAQRQMQNYIQRVKRFRKSRGLPDLKYVAVTKPNSKGHMYHHIVMNGGVDIDDLTKFWGRGIAFIKPLQLDGTNIAILWRYLIKGQCYRWSASRNLGDSSKQRGIEDALDGFVPGGVVRVSI